MNCKVKYIKAFQECGAIFWFCGAKMIPLHHIYHTLQWDIAVTRIGQLASEMRLSTGGYSVGGSNGNGDELTNWDGTKKRGLGR